MSQIFGIFHSVSTQKGKAEYSLGSDVPCNTPPAVSGCPCFSSHPGAWPFCQWGLRGPGRQFTGRSVYREGPVKPPLALTGFPAVTHQPRARSTQPVRLPGQILTAGTRQGKEAFNPCSCNFQTPSRLQSSPALTFLVKFLPLQTIDNLHSSQ